MSKLRPVEEYGDVSLSVQASSCHYSTPRADGLPIDLYTHVELGLIGPVEKALDSFFGPISTCLCRPSEIGIHGFDHLFEDGDAPVAGFVPVAEVEKLRNALRDRAALAKEVGEQA